MATNFTSNNIASIKLKDTIYHIKSIPLHGTSAEWERNSSYVPAQGEIVVYDADSTSIRTRFKIGDGVTVVGNLPFEGVQDTAITSASVTINEDGVSTITIPGNITNTDNLLVYHNGLLLTKGIEYSISAGSIVLNGYTSLAGDLFLFISMISPTTIVGKGAYECAQEGGYSRTEAEFYTDLAAIENLAAELEGLL